MSMMWQKLMMAEAAPSGYSCTITIGENEDTGLYGYSQTSAGDFGSIDAEPIPGEVLNVCIWDAANFMAIEFETDILSLVGTLDVWIGGVNYGGAGSWAYDAGFTSYFVFTFPVATSGTVLLEIK